MLEGFLVSDSQPEDYDPRAQSSLRLQSFLLNVAVTLLWLGSSLSVRHLLLELFGLSWPHVLLGAAAATVLITALLYVYSVYLVHWLHKKPVLPPVSSAVADTSEEKTRKKGLFHDLLIILTYL